MTDLPKLIADHRIASAAQLLAYLSDDGWVSDYDRMRSELLRRWLATLMALHLVTRSDGGRNRDIHLYTLTDKGKTALARHRK